MKRDRLVMLVVLAIMSAFAHGCGIVKTPIPPEIPQSDLQLWLRADAGVVTNTEGNVTLWRDQSFVRNDAVVEFGSGPLLISDAINREPALGFGGDTRLVVGHNDGLNASGDGFSVCVVYRYDQGLRLMQKRDNVVGTGEDAWFVDPATGICVAGKGVSNTMFGAGESWHMQISIYNANEGVIGVYGKSRMLGQVDGVISQVANAHQLAIGGRVHKSPLLLKGEIAEIIIYNRPLSDSERSQVQEYLAGKYFGE